MKMTINKRKKYQLSLFLLMLFGIGLFSLSSCELFTTADLEENQPESTNETSTNSNEEGTLLLVVSPYFTDNFRAAITNRSAYPDFASELSNFEFYAVCTSSFGEKKGTYDSTEGTVTFDITSTPFTNKTIEFFARNSTSHVDLLYAKIENVNFNVAGQEINTSLYFQEYTSATGRPDDNPTPNGYISLQVSAQTGSKIVCRVYDSSATPLLVSGATASGSAIEISGTDNAITIQTVTAGIAPGKYTAKIFIYKDGNDGSSGGTPSNPDYREEIINVWPGITTNRWYLSDGSKNQDLSITITPGVKFYVKGSDPTGPYADGGVTLPASYTPNGTILAPFSSLQAAINLCQSSSASYRIILCGTVNESITIGENVAIAAAITIEGSGNSENNIINGGFSSGNEGRVFEITRMAVNITLKNITITGGFLSGASDYGAGIFVDAQNYPAVNIENSQIIGNTAKKGGGIYIGDSASVKAFSGTLIKNNSADEGGAVYCGTGGFFYMGGSAYIPYGISGTKAAGKNDIYLSTSCKIQISGKLTPPAECLADDKILAAIKPQTYDDTNEVLRIASSAQPATSLKKEHDKFTVVPDSADPSINWGVGMSGKLVHSTSLLTATTTSGLNSTFDGSSAISSSEVFKSQRKIGTIKSIIASDHETTQGEYEKYCQYGGTAPSDEIGKGDYYPAYNVSWYDAIIYCNLRSIDDGLEPVYVVGGKTNPSQWTNIVGNAEEGYCAPASCSWDVTIQGDKNGWRLPTEIEWEFLARGGDLTATQTTFSGSNIAADVAWYGPSEGDDGTANGQVHPVKTKNPNNLDIYDMSGNVWEWTNDWHSNASSYPWIPLDTPTSGSYQDKSNSRRVTKGGGYSGGVGQSPVYNRGSSSPNYRNSDMGFRVVRGAQYVGSKLPSVYKEVGDIVFNDGSATPYTSGMTITNDQKSAAIGLIFYKGTGLNSDDSEGNADTTTIRTLGVGLKHDQSGRAWCTSGADAWNKNIITIQCPNSGSAGAFTFTGDKNGSDNLVQIEAFDGVSDTTVASKYPAFYFGKNYKDLTGSHVSGTAYEDGWYLPSIAELFQIYACRADTSNGFNVDIASQALGGTMFVSSEYWSSSQVDSINYDACLLSFSNGDVITNIGKNTTTKYACAIHEF